MAWAVAFICAALPVPAVAHHGGLAIDWDDPNYDAASTRWQQEVVTNGYRIKFLAYPRNVLVGNSTRLVFEVQAVANGIYISGLKPEIVLRSEGGEDLVVAMPETEGVTGYYETRYVFTRSGQFQISFRVASARGPIVATFQQPVRRIDAYQVLGLSTTGAACLVTWLGMIVALRRRMLGE